MKTPMEIMREAIERIDLNDNLVFLKHDDLSPLETKQADDAYHQNLRDVVLPDLKETMLAFLSIPDKEDFKPMHDGIDEMAKKYVLLQSCMEEGDCYLMFTKHLVLRNPKVVVEVIPLHVSKGNMYFHDPKTFMHLADLYDPPYDHSKDAQAVNKFLANDKPSLFGIENPTIEKHRSPMPTKSWWRKFF